MPWLISSAHSQKLFSISVFASMCFLFLYILQLFLFTGWSRSAAAATGHHSNAGVLQYVNPRIGTYGVTPNGNGGMIPSVSPPFGMTRWTPQTRENFISQCPYNELDDNIHGFQATHQPAIWMGENGQVVLVPGVGDVKPRFVDRAHPFDKKDERSTPYLYEVSMQAKSIEADHNLTESIYSPVPGGAGEVPDVVREGANGRIRRAIVPADQAGSAEHGVRVQKRAKSDTIKAYLTASSHVGHLRFDYPKRRKADAPYVLIEATRQNWTGHVEIHPKMREIAGSNSERQDYLLGPLKAPGFSAYFVSRFSEDFTSYGITQAGKVHKGTRSGKGSELGAYAKFSGSRRVEIRTGVSFISVEQARKNLDIEAGDVHFEQAVEELKQAWLEKLGRVTIEGVNKTKSEHDPRTIFYTGLFHALQYPSDFSEPTTKGGGGMRTFYSGYTDSVHTEHDSYYQSWSIWDTFRAEHSLITMFAPERVNGMMRSLVYILGWAGRLPMWANLVETNIMIGTHVDAVIANALVRGFKSFSISKLWEGVRKNAYVPPINDTELLFYDREPDTPDEVRAGLTTYLTKGYVANDGWSESGSRTLDYAFDDHAAAVVAEHAGDKTSAKELRERSMNYDKIYNNKTGFMEARNGNGTWAGPDQGWAEGDDYIYTFNVMHDPRGLAKLMGGRDKMKAKLDEYFNGGHNDHSNEPSHHAPYLYAAIGYPYASQNLTRQIAWTNYNATPAGLSGNEDLGQMSAWYVFSALGFYPVNSASDEYVVGSPFFEKVTIRFPAGAATGGIGGEESTLTITAPKAPQRPFVKSLKVDGIDVHKPILRHQQIVTAKHIAFDMAAKPQDWGLEKA